MSLVQFRPKAPHREALKCAPSGFHLKEKKALDAVSLFSFRYTPRRRQAISGKHGKRAGFSSVCREFSFFLFFCENADAAIAHLVERHLAKVEVASSSLVGRSTSEIVFIATCGASAAYPLFRRFLPQPNKITHFVRRETTKTKV